MGRADTPMKYRLGIDLGTGSLGWAVLELNAEGEPFRIERLGSRIFGTGRKPKDNSSLAADRRQARSVRRRHDRYLQRRNRLLTELTASDLFPIDLAARAALKKLQPFQLRAEGLERALTPHEFGRALYHLQQRRGFKSNRKADKGLSDSGAMKQAIARTRELIPGGQTVGSFLWGEIRAGRGARARHEGDGAKRQYDFYVDREMVNVEFAALWEAQLPHHPALLTESARDNIHHAIFDQRPLKPVDPGKCRYEEGERRAPNALVTTQLFRLWSEVNSLRVRDARNLHLDPKPLTREQRDEAIAFLKGAPRRTLPEIRKHLFGVAPGLKFTHEQGERAHFKGDEVSAALSNSNAFEDGWWDLSLDQQDDIARGVDDLGTAVKRDQGGQLSEWTDDLMMNWLASEHGLDAARARYVTNLSLPQGFGHHSTVAMRKILWHLTNGWDTVNDKALTYSEAVDAIAAEATVRGDASEARRYRSHSERHTGELFDRLPYYGRVLSHYTQEVARTQDDFVRRALNPDEAEYGRIANPTVHIGLNQVRIVVNALVARYGAPHEIHVELARELGQSEKARDESSRVRAENERRNGILDKELTEVFGRPATRANREKLRLFKDLGALNHTCVYTGKPVTAANLFTKEFEVDHILPFQHTLDDSYGNKMLIHHSANAFKSGRSPFDAYGDSPEWPVIVERASKIRRVDLGVAHACVYGKDEGRRACQDPTGRSSVNRFGEGAMERYSNGDQDFIARQLTDTAYLAVAAKEYVGSLIDPERVWALPGRLTGLLRGKWGLNKLLGAGDQKDRSDHRHHAIDAAVIALTDRGTLQRVTEANRRAGGIYGADEDGAKKLLKDFKEPWDGFYREMERKVAGIVVSHRPDHGPEGRLHEDTAYKVSDHRKKGDGVEYLISLHKPYEPSAKDRKAGVRSHEASECGSACGFHKPRWSAAIPIFRRGEGPDSALPYKAYIGGSNYCIEIVRRSSGKWAGEVISTFQANTQEYQDFMKDKAAFHRSSVSGTPLVMRLVAGDTIAIEQGDSRRIMRLCVLNSAGRMSFAEHNEGNVDARDTETRKARKGSSPDPDRDMEEASAVERNGLFSYMLKNSDPLRKLQARRVFVDPLGNVLDPGFRP
jgi:CRISPR-associated endonuclease Csn1